jgi:hypothetical protein
MRLAVFTVEGRVSTRIGPRLPRRAAVFVVQAFHQNALHGQPSKPPQEHRLTAITLGDDQEEHRPAQRIASAACNAGAQPSQDTTRWHCPRPLGSPIALSATGWWHTLPVATASHLCADPGGLLERIPSPLTLVRDLGKTSVRTALSPRYLIKDEVPGSSPGKPTTQHLTSRNAGHLHVRDGFGGPCTGWTPLVS